MFNPVKFNPTINIGGVPGLLKLFEHIFIKRGNCLIFFYRGTTGVLQGYYVLCIDSLPYFGFCYLSSPNTGILFKMSLPFAGRDQIMPIVIYIY